MTQSRRKIEKALKEIVILLLKKKGFQGTFPHFRRFSKNEINMITFQFNRYEGSFTINIGKCPPSGITLRWADGTTKHIPPQKVNCYQDPGNAIITRLGFLSHGGIDHWYEYDKTDSVDKHKRLAEEVLEDLKTANHWWESEKLLN